MATDYLEKKFPTYVLTKDTKVVPLKNYYRLDGTSYKRVLDAAATDNPKSNGWYQRVLNHNREFHYHTESFQVNNVSYICSGMVRQMNLFPRWNLDRQTESGGTTINWRSSFFDTKWLDLIGDIPVPEYCVPFAMNIFFAKNINPLVKSIATNNGTSTLLSSFRSVIGLSTSGKTYDECGYKFESSTLGNSLRADDTYTCATYWSTIDWRTSKMIFQDAARHCSGADQQTLCQIVVKMDDCARTMIDLAKYVTEITIQPSDKFACRVMPVTPTFSFSGQTLYRLCFVNQLINNMRYGRIFVNATNELQMFSIREIQNPSTKFVSFDLPMYNPSSIPTTEDVLYDDIQSGKVWFTDVPFNGILT